MSISCILIDVDMILNQFFIGKKKEHDIMILKPFFLIKLHK